MHCARCGLSMVRKAYNHTYCPTCRKLVDKDLIRQSKGAAPWDVFGSTFRCVVCQGEGLRTGPRQKYCSDACYALAERERRREKEGCIHVHGTVEVCVACGTVFSRRSGSQKYCSERCSTQQRNVRRREQLGRTQFVGIVFPCAICGRLSTRVTGVQIYCSEGCKGLAQYRQRARRLKSQIGLPYTRRQIFERDGWRCRSCWKKVRDNVPLQHPARSTVDHIVPLTKGGKECESNVQTLCWPCNHKKGNRLGDNDQLRLALGLQDLTHGDLAALAGR
jgi:predicted nucleic acid-binding Zn ribbon protein